MEGMCTAAAAVPIVGAAYAPDYLEYWVYYEAAFNGTPPEESDTEPPVITPPEGYPTTPAPVTYYPLPTDERIDETTVSPPYSPQVQTVDGFLTDIRHYVTRFNRHLAPDYDGVVKLLASIPLVDAEYLGQLPSCDGFILYLTYIPPQYGRMFVQGQAMRYPHIGWVMFLGQGSDRVQLVETTNDIMIPEVLSSFSGVAVKCKVGVTGVMIPFQINIMSD
jgi:hypothetical protein